MTARAPKTASSPTKPPAFPGYSKPALRWLRSIARRVDDRDWFLANKDLFEREVKEPTEALVEWLAAKVLAFAPEYVPSEPRKAVQRIYRDMRFVRDGTRYKTALNVRLETDETTRAATAAGGLRGTSFWISISGKGVEVAGGAYRQGNPRLAALRAHIAEDPQALRKVLQRKPLREALGALRGERRRHTPPEFELDHPASDLLKMNQLYLSTRLPVAVMTTPELSKEILRRFKLMLPFMAFLEAGFASAE